MNVKVSVLEASQLNVERRKHNIEELVRVLLYDELQVPAEDPNFQETPRRFATYLWEHFYGEPLQVLEGFRESVFPSRYDGMLTETGISVSGMCPHHLLTVSYSISIGYLVSGKVLGVSKLVRLARAYASKPLLQEDITELIADGLEKLLETKGVGVVVVGRHSCMEVRGVRAAPKVTTSTVRGVLRESASAKEEFLMLTREVK